MKITQARVQALDSKTRFYWPVYTKCCSDHFKETRGNKKMYTSYKVSMSPLLNETSGQHSGLGQCKIHRGFQGVVTSQDQVSQHMKGMFETTYEHRATVSTYRRFSQRHPQGRPSHRRSLVRQTVPPLLRYRTPQAGSVRERRSQRLMPVHVKVKRL